MKDKYVLITGAYGGLGSAMARVFASRGFGLVLLGRNREKLQELKKNLGKKTDCLTLTADVSDKTQMEQAAELLHAKGITIHILINNAGISYIRRFGTEYELERMQEVLDTNLKGSIYATYYFWKDISDNNGSIINISSVIGYAPVTGRTAYAASKFGMEGFFSTLAAENPGMHIMMVYPTFIQTGIRDEQDKDKTVNEVLTPAFVAEKIFRGFEKGKKRIYIGKTARLARFLYKFFPGIYIRMMRKKTK